jgi:hypothetical protein
MEKQNLYDNNIIIKIEGFWWNSTYLLVSTRTNPYRSHPLQQ